MKSLEQLREIRWKESGWFPKQTNLTVAYQVERDNVAFSAALTEDHFQLSAERVDSTDAYIQYNEEQNAYVIVPETLGNHIDSSVLERV